MYFENPKKSYYRFPSKNIVTDFDAQIPYYFPTKSSYANNDLTGNYLDPDYKNTNPSSDISQYGNNLL